MVLTAATARVPKDLKPNLQRTTAIVSVYSCTVILKCETEYMSQKEFESYEMSRFVWSRAIKARY